MLKGYARISQEGIEALEKYIEPARSEKENDKWNKSMYKPYSKN